MPHKVNAACHHHIPRPKQRVTNCAEYNEALRQRGSLTVWVKPEALKAWAPRQSERRCQPTFYSDIVIESAVMLRLAIGMRWQQTEGVLNSIIQMLGLILLVPDHTTLFCRSARL
jgi:Transposase DDE domain